MGKLIVTEFVSLDGVIEAPGGEPGYPHSGWTIEYHDEEQMKFKLDEVLAAAALLIGRRTYEGFSEAWPGRSGEFADKMNDMPKYVISATLSDPQWSNTTVIDGDAVAEVKRLKDEIDGEILVAGSGTLVHALIDNDLVDEFRLMTFPVILGSGKRLYPERADKAALELAETQAFASGVQVHTYRRTD